MVKEVGVHVLSPRIPAGDAAMEYERFFRLADNLMLVVDFDGHILRINDAITRYLGWSEDDIVGRTWLSLVHPDDAEIARLTVADMMHRGEVWEAERRYLHKNGLYHCLKWRCESIPAQKKIYCVADDVTVRHALDSSERRLRFLNRLDSETRFLKDPLKIMEQMTRLVVDYFDATRCAWADMEPDGNSFTIRADHVRDDAASTVGFYRLDGFGTKAITDLNAGRPLVLRDIRAELAPEDGADLFASIGINAIITCPLIKEGRLHALMAVHQKTARAWTDDDVSLMEAAAERCWATIERARSEIILRETAVRLNVALEEAHKASRAKTDFLANMSHEIRTPMNAVIGLTSILLQSETAEKNQLFLKTLKTSADQLMTLINDMLDFSRIESGLVELERDWFSPCELLRSCLSVISVEARRKHLSLVSHEDCSVRCEVYEDIQRVRQILMNLLSNAVKFTAQGRVSVRCVIDTTDDGDVLEICVRDTGIGIPPEKARAIFDKFTQADSSISKRFGGTGLGLSISRSLAELMGGAIVVESEVNVGSTFTLRIPVQTRQRDGCIDEQAGKGPVSAVTDPHRILLVEDNPTNVMVATGLLEQLGYSVDVADCGRDALEKSAQARYDLILMDVQMSEMDGYETTRRIRARENGDGRRVPIIAMTAHAFSDHKDLCLQAGMDDFLPKPFKLENLSEKIRSLIGKDGT